MTSSIRPHVPFGTLRLKWVVRFSRQIPRNPKKESSSHPRRRQRRFRCKLNRKAKKERVCTPIIALRKDECGPAHVVPRIPRGCPKARLVRIKQSKRWLECPETPSGAYGVPFIDRLGFYTGHLAYRWACDPRSLIATVISTISSRLVGFCRRHNKKWVVNRYLSDILKASAYYAISKNSYFWDRILVFCRDLTKYNGALRSLRVHFLARWDDNKRFVYSQASYQANWLLFRANLPRDKSHFYSERRVRNGKFNELTRPLPSEIYRQVIDISTEISMV